MTQPAYVLERFPERTQTFVQNELRALRPLGVRPRIFALYPHEDLDDGADDLGFEQLPSASTDPPALARAARRVLRAHPAGLAAAVGLAGMRPSRFQSHCLAKAVLLADRLVADPPGWLHAHFARASASTAMLAATILGVPFSFTAHGADLFYRPFDLDRKLARAAVAVTVCDYNRRWIQQRWPGASPVVVPCGVDPGRFERSRPYCAGPPLAIAAVGRLVPKKGFTHLVRACARLRDGGIDFRCQIAGGGPLEAELNGEISRLSLGSQVTLMQSISGDGVRELLESASVFCLPAVVSPDGDRDSQPVVLKEAMAMAVPVVASREVGIPELVDDAVGCLVPAGDPEALAAALAGLAAVGSSNLEALGRAARARIEAGFTVERQARGLVDAWAAAGLAS